MSDTTNPFEDQDYTSSLHLRARPRRNRKSAAVRGLVRETELNPAHFVLPLFVREGTGSDEIESMPGVKRWGVETVSEEVSEANQLGICNFVLFPCVAPELKTRRAEEAYNDAGLVPRVIQAIRSNAPEVNVITDVALDPYNSDGHDGLVSDEGKILNDETVEVLCQQALSHARAGADVISPSDMMDGRVEAIRNVLDRNEFTDISILSYTAKYASAFYGPFRGALESAPKSGDKKTYQMDPANAREALREADLDSAEGADMLMVKPAGPYLDVIRRLRDHSSLPIAAYQVSGEFLMIKSAAAAGWLDERAIVLESLVGIRRAGADVILTYFSKEAARWLREGK
jgi:porphobilinogen synthase